MSKSESSKARVGTPSVAQRMAVGDEESEQMPEPLLIKWECM